MFQTGNIFEQDALAEKKTGTANLKPSCNICNGTVFETYRGRPGEKCAGCGAKARHRIALDVYQRFLEPVPDFGARLLHLAPEPSLHNWLGVKFGAGYLCADAAPERYPHAEVLKLVLPQGFEIFPDGYFHAIIHNHVLEHIPGNFTTHLEAFVRILRPGGHMIFSVPGPYIDRLTEEGGEHLKSPAERLVRFKQEDHLKIFGADFVSHIQNIPGGLLVPDGVTDEKRAELSVRPGKARFFVWRKHLN
jgi:SAM-dependent methyltransferase